MPVIGSYSPREFVRWYIEVQRQIANSKELSPARAKFKDQERFLVFGFSELLDFAISDKYPRYMRDKISLDQAKIVLDVLAIAYQKNSKAITMDLALEGCRIVMVGTHARVTVGTKDRSHAGE